MRKFAKFIALCGALFLLICCILLGGCRKTKQQDGSFGTKTTVKGDILDDDLIIEIETHGTTATSKNITGRTTQSSVKTTDGTAKTTMQRTQNSTSSSSAKTTNPASSSNATSSSNAGTVDTVTTKNTTQKGWSPDLGKKPQ